jgi:hypothetical protein
MRGLAILAVGLLALVAAPGPAAATVVFFDDFESPLNQPPNLNAVPTGWSVADGTVDVVGSTPGGSGSGWGHLCSGSPSPTTCVDLDGSTSDAGVLTANPIFGAGSYELSFWLAGNQRGGTDTVRVSYGSGFQDFTRLFDDPFALETVSFTAPGTFQISFENLYVDPLGDNVGLMLDDVQLDADAVPEPGSLLLLGSGLSALALRRRRKA